MSLLVSARGPVSWANGSSRLATTVWGRASVIGRAPSSGIRGVTFSSHDPAAAGSQWAAAVAGGRIPSVCEGSWRCRLVRAAFAATIGAIEPVNGDRRVWGHDGRGHSEAAAASGLPTTWDAASIPAVVQRIVSLVPSLTETVAACSPGLLVGATEWCTHPADLAVRRIGGTKNPDIRAILELRPDIVLANEEENREPDLDALRGRAAVWVTRIRDLP